MSVAFRVDQVEYPFPAKPQPLSEARKAELKAEIKALLKPVTLCLSHTITPTMKFRHSLKRLVAAWQTHWKWRASEEMHKNKPRLVAGVRFMGETAKILSPEKTVLMPTLEATCSLDIGCPVKSLANSVISTLTTL